jgi:hypothetical protein
MARLFFFVLAGAFVLAAACLPLRSESDSTWAEVTVGGGCEDFGTGIWPDRHFDFPTGAGYYFDMPVWLLDTGLMVGAFTAFGVYVRKKLREQAAA